jgi:hypothetical protein
MAGRGGLPESLRRRRRARAAQEVAHFAAMIENEPIGVQIGIALDTPPHTGFQVFRQPDRRVLTVSPFRLGEQPNVRVGVAMLTSAPEALALYEKTAQDLWRGALKGQAAVAFLRELMARYAA